MNSRTCRLVAVLLIAFSMGSAHAQTDAAAFMRLHAELLAANGNKLVQDVYYQSPKDTTLKLELRCYKAGKEKDDSTLVYRIEAAEVKLKKGGHVHSLKLGQQGVKAFVLPVFKDILIRAGQIPAGSYRLYLSAGAKDSNAAQPQQFVFLADSNLALTSPVRDDVNEAVLPDAASSHTQPGKGPSTLQLLERAGNKIQRAAKSRGLSTQIETKGGKQFIHYSYEDWYVGYYKADLATPIAAQIAQTRQQLSSAVGGTLSSGLQSYTSLFGQIRELKKQAVGDNELSGNIALAGNWATGQPEYSQQDNNFYELRGGIQTAVFDIPVGIDGYYTTQDRNRSARASYIHFYYDVDKAKESLMKMIGGYSQAYSQTTSKGQGLQQIYGSFLGTLKSQGTALAARMARESGVPVTTGSDGSFQIDTAAARAQIMAQLEKEAKQQAAKATDSLKSTADSSESYAKAAALKDSAEQRYTQLMKRYEELRAMQQKATQYQKLLEQYNNTSYFDSLLAYDQVKDLENVDQMSYKQLAKKASNLLPEGKAKKFVSGLTSFDAGIFPKYLSKYTAAGQQIKGLDAGYDLGFCTVGIMAGYTEFVSRSGTPDRYTTYSGRMAAKPFKNHEVGLVYYGYSPSRSLLRSNNDFFQNVDIALPTFMEPMHILSATYVGVFGKGIRVDGEAATSFRKHETRQLAEALDHNRLAWSVSAEGDVPRSPVTLVASYEHGGKDFRNSTLPVTISGTDRYRAGAKGDFFRNVLHLGVDYNHMEQQSFPGKGGNNRWGFEIGTRSKRYPSVTLSYKPFATFRTLDDTFNVPQRPLIGAVWTGRGSYQIKNKQRAWRLSLVWNQSHSEQDAYAYSSTLLQAGCIYTDKKWSWQVNGGRTASSSSQPETNATHQDVNFINAQGSRILSESLSLSGGLDAGTAAFGLTRYGANLNAAYRMKQAPVGLRAYYRYSGYRLEAANPWRIIHAGGIELFWEFRMRLKQR